jgi:hypothetical protein
VAAHFTAGGEYGRIAKMTRDFLDDPHRSAPHRAAPRRSELAPGDGDAGR